MNGMLAASRLAEFVEEVINIHNEEYKDKTLWDIWLHRVFDKSFTEFSQSLETNNAAAPTDAEVADIVTETKNMLNHFSPE